MDSESSGRGVTSALRFASCFPALGDFSDERGLRRVPFVVVSDPEKRLVGRVAFSVVVAQRVILPICASDLLFLVSVLDLFSALKPGGAGKRVAKRSRCVFFILGIGC